MVRAFQLVSRAMIMALWLHCFKILSLSSGLHECLIQQTSKGTSAGSLVASKNRLSRLPKVVVQQELKDEQLGKTWHIGTDRFHLGTGTDEDVVSDAVGFDAAGHHHIPPQWLATSLESLDIGQLGIQGEKQ